MKGGYAFEPFVEEEEEEVVVDLQGVSSSGSSRGDSSSSRRRDKLSSQRMGGPGADANAPFLSKAICASANFGVQYNFGSISIALIVMSSSVCTNSTLLCQEGIQQPWVLGTSSAVIFVGAIAGQLSMGYVGDVIGRNRAMLLTTSISFVSSLLSAIVPTGSPDAIYAIIVVFRFFLGIGLGGIFPLSAAKAGEDSARAGASHSASKVDPVATGKAYFWQVPGILGPWLLAYILTFTDLSSDGRWRLLLACGCIPLGISVVGLLYESYVAKQSQQVVENEDAYKQAPPDSPSLGSVNKKTLPAAAASQLEEAAGITASAAATATTSTTLTRHSIPIPPKEKETSSSNLDARDSAVIVDVQSAQARQAKQFHIALTTDLRSTTRKMIGCGVCWFLFDILAYGVGLFSGEIIHAIMPASPDVSSDVSVRSITSLNLIVMALGIPACAVSINFINCLGLKWMQVIAFLIIGVFCLLMAVLFYKLRQEDPKGLFAIYCFLGMSMNFGCNITSFVLPSVLFHKDIRTTFNGFAAALGKLGAVLGAYAFGPIAESSSSGFAVVMYLCFFVALLGALLSYLYIDIPSSSGNDQGALLDESSGSSSNYDAEKGNELSFSVSSTAASHISSANNEVLRQTGDFDVEEDPSRSSRL